MTTQSERLRSRLVADLQASGAITSPVVRQAFLDIPRERFVPDALALRGLEGVYRDEVIVAKTDGRGMPISSSSQPAIMAIMLEKLELTGGQRILEIGTGTGYNAALLAALVGPGGDVVSVELDADLAARALSRLRDGGHHARVVVGDGRKGWEQDAPYDRIIATASADGVPRPWCDQLVDGGLVELPLRLNGVTDAQAVVTFRKVDSALESTSVIGGGFMAIRTRAADGYPDPSSLSLSWSVGTRRRHVAVMGDVIRRFDPPSRRRLACLLADDPRRLSLGRRSTHSSLDAFLAVSAEPNLVICVSGGTRGTGVMSSDGGSLACLGGGKPLGPPTRVYAWGDDGCSDRLMELLREYWAMGSPDISQLSVHQAYAAKRSAVVLSYRWPAPGRRVGKPRASR